MIALEIPNIVNILKLEFVHFVKPPRDNLNDNFNSIFIPILHCILLMMPYLNEIYFILHFAITDERPDQKCFFTLVKYELLFDLQKNHNL